MRTRLEEFVKASLRWDGRFCNLQVIDRLPEAIEVRSKMQESLVRYRGDVEFRQPQLEPART